MICKVTYDTETATMVEQHTSGFFGDPAGYEETLYQTSDGKYFLYVTVGKSLHIPKKTSRECLVRRQWNGSRSKMT